MNRREMDEIVEQQIPRLAENEKERWARAEKLRKRFVRDFSPAKIADMELDDYVIGRGANNPSFCYRLEQETRDLGLIFGATAYKFGIYYSKTGKLPYPFRKRWGKTASEAFTSVKNEILALLHAASQKDIQALNQNHLYSIVKGKLLFIYHPDEYFPIYSRDHLKYFVAELNIPANSASSIEMQCALVEYWKAWPVSKKYSTLQFMHLLYQTFPGVKKPTNSAERRSVLPALDLAVKGAKFINQMPALSNRETKKKSKRHMDGKTDFLELQKRSKRIGDRGEAIVKSMEERRLTDEGRPDLAKKIKHISDTSDKEGYDILSFDADGTPRYVEVKATSASNLDRGFYLSKNELEESKSLHNYYIYFVFSAMGANPKVLPVREPNLKGGGYNLNPVSYRVTLNPLQNHKIGIE